MTPRPVARGRMRLPLITLAVLSSQALLAPLSPLAAQKKSAAPAAPPPAAKVDTIRLRFDWPVGMTATVEQLWMRTRTTGARTDTMRLPSTYRLQVLSHPKGRLVRTDRFTLPPIAPGTGGEQEQLQRIAANVGGMQPSFVVTDSGEFVQVEDVARMKAALDSMLAPMLRDMGGAPPQLRGFIATFTSEAALSASAAQEWNALAGTWVGAEWELGEVYEMRVEEPIAILPGLEVPIVYQFSATERVPCEEGAPPGGCIALEMRSSPDSAGMKRLLDRLMQEMAGEEGRKIAAMLGDLRVENELTVVAEPRTLRPYSTLRVRRSTARGAGDGSPGVVQQDVRMTRFRYPAAGR